MFSKVCIFMLLMLPTLGIAQGQSFIFRMMQEHANANNWWPSTANAVAYWRAGLTGDASDGIGGYTAIPTNGATVVSGEGFTGAGNGTDDYVVVPDDDAFTLSGAYTISLWVKFDVSAPSEDQHIIGKANFVINQREYFLRRVSPSNTLAFYHTSTLNPWSYTTFFPTNVLSNSTWYQIAVTSDGVGNAKMYLNGSEIATSASWNTTMENGTADLTFLGYKNGNLVASEVDGAIDEVSIFNVSLSASDIGAYYTNSFNAEFSTR